MKKTLTLMSIIALAASVALAQHHGPGPCHDRAGKDSPDCDMSGPGPMAGKAMRGGPACGDGPMSAEMRDEIRAEHRAIRDLAGAIRVESDEARKAELTEELRGKLGGITDRVQQHQRNRFRQAQEQLDELGQRIEQAEQNRDKLIDEQVQRLIAGERPACPQTYGDFPYAKERKGYGDKRPAKAKGPRGRKPDAPSATEE